MSAHDALWESARARALIEAGDVGGAVRFARQARGWRQEELAQATGYSRSTISRLETGHRDESDLGILRRVARAVEIPSRVLGALLGISAPNAATVTVTNGPPAEGDPMRRRTVLATGLAVPSRLLTRLDDALALLPSPKWAGGLEVIANQLLHARTMFDVGNINRLVADLPELLAAAHEMVENDGRPTTYECLADCYNLAAEALNKIGHYQTSRVTADRATTFAAISGNPIAMAAAARCLGIVLRHEDRQQIADQATLHAANRLEATGLTLPAQAATYAQMLCTCAYNAAQADDRARALEMIAEADRAARKLPPHPVDGQPYTVTPAHVTLYRVGVHWSLGDAGTALWAGRNLHPAQFSTPERRGRLHTDLARAWWQLGRPEQTACSLLAAYRQAPGEVRDRPGIRKIVLSLATQHPRTAEVRQLSTLMGRRSPDSY